MLFPPSYLTRPEGTATPRTPASPDPSRTVTPAGPTVANRLTDRLTFMLQVIVILVVPPIIAIGVADYLAAAVAITRR
ncbi:hypothetical protein OHS18_02955 [Amycolatopsis sp. NBC_00355]|uniref:hypothetical protein n=1 Tax=Amycolatopsis sp. NBC_00355 TaxID=2975957 RepID=UPI002E261720